MYYYGYFTVHAFLCGVGGGEQRRQKWQNVSQIPDLDAIAPKNQISHKGRPLTSITAFCIFRSSRRHLKTSRVYNSYATASSEAKYNSDESTMTEPMWIVPPPQSKIIKSLNTTRQHAAEQDGHAISHGWWHWCFLSFNSRHHNTWYPCTSLRTTSVR